MATTAEQYKERALREVGRVQINAMFELHLPVSVSAGTFTGTFNGSTTSAIAYNTSAEAMQAKMEAIDSIEPGNILVEGVKKGPYYLEFMGELGGQAVPFPSFNGTSLTPSTPTLRAILVRQGKTQDFSSDVELLWEEYGSMATTQLRYWYVKLGLIDLALGAYVDMVDHSTGQTNRVDSKDNQRYTNLLKMRGVVLNDIDRATGEGPLSAAQSQTYFGAIAKTTPNGQPFGVLRRDQYGRLV